MACSKLTFTVTFAFCVPVCWKPESNAILSRIIVDALRRVQFGVSGHCDVPTVFMFNEAETAMTYIVEAAPVRITVRPYLYLYVPVLIVKQSNQFVIILDCGGGTIDGGEYQVSSGPPFRLEKEVNNPTGKFYSAVISCGLTCSRTLLRVEPLE